MTNGIEISKLKERLTEIQNLVDKKEILTSQLIKVDKEIEALLTSIFPKVKTKTKPNRGLAHSLNNYLLRAMAPGAEMSPKKIASKVIELGYQTSSKTFANDLIRQLILMKDVVRVRHGVYMRKGIRPTVRHLTNKEFHHEKPNC